MADEDEIGPNVSIQQVSHRRQAKAGTWLLHWEIKNLSRAPLTIVAVRLPHSQFRSPEQAISPTLKVPPQGTVPLGIDLACPETSGIVIENAFLILRVLWRQNPWRILARLRVAIDTDGAPQSVTELITTQRVGFSERGL
jgi:hypothetical protein